MNSKVMLKLVEFGITYAMSHLSRKLQSLKLIRQITSRLLEAVERGMWDASDDTVEALKSIFMDNDASLERMNDRS